jgi:hypothetical protein
MRLVCALYSVFKLTAALGRLNSAALPSLIFANPTPDSIAISKFSFLQIRRLLPKS